MGDDDISWGLSSMAVCFDFRSTNVVQLSNRNLLLAIQCVSEVYLGCRKV